MLRGQIKGQSKGPRAVLLWFSTFMRNTRHEALRLAEARQLASSGDGRRIRERVGLSLPEVARAVGVSHVTIGRWERGTRVPRHPAATRWAELLSALEKGHPNVA
jgi:DNA-binding transcriptional regulator YiaG